MDEVVKTIVETHLYTEAELSQRISQYMIALLENGVPSAVVARVFEIDEQDAKTLLSSLRARRYGSSEITELMQGLLFKAYARTVYMMEHGNPAEKQRVTSLVLNRGLAMMGKQSPETFERMRDDMLSLMSDVGTTVTDKAPSIYADRHYSPDESKSDVDEDS